MTGGTDFCNPDALIAFADSTEALGESIDGLLAQLDGARVPEGAFGRMPSISERIYTAYDEHVDEAKLGVTQTQSALLGATLPTACTSLRRALDSRSACRISTRTACTWTALATCRVEVLMPREQATLRLPRGLNRRRSADR